MWRVIRTKQFTIAFIIATIIAVRHCHAAAAVGAGLKFADVVKFVVGMHRATSGSNFWEQLLVVGVVNRDCVKITPLRSNCQPEQPLFAHASTPPEPFVFKISLRLHLIVYITK